MSRKEEQARNSLWRWQAAARQGAVVLGGHNNNKRPRLASECNSIVQCEETRTRLVKDIGKKVEDIQNPRLTHDEARKINEEINKLMNIKGHWERQIRALGGPDYRDVAHGGGSSSSSGTATRGKEGLVRIGNVTYYGVAKNLPEVVEGLAARTAAAAAAVTTTGGEEDNVGRGAMHESQLSHQYYGLHDEDLAVLDAESQVRLRARLAREWVPPSSTATTTSVVIDTPSAAANAKLHWDETFSIPTEQEIDDAILEFKKRQLLLKFV